MTLRISLVCLMLAATSSVSGCVPVVVGGAGAIAADTIAEDRHGGDGLF